MYFETTMHTSKPVDTAAIAAQLIKEHTVRDLDALIWTAPNGRRLAVVADNHCNNPWLEVAVIDIDRSIQIESITAGWCTSAHELRGYLEDCETTDSVIRSGVSLPLDGKSADTLAHFTCGCCGTSFQSTYEIQRQFDQDNGYGICPKCC